MFWESEKIIQYFTDYGYIFLLLGLTIEGEVVLLTASLVAYLLGYSMPVFLLAAIICTLAGNHLWYFLGRLLKGDFVEKYGKFIFLPPARYIYLKKYLSQNGKSTLFFSKFMYGIGHVSIMAAAVLGMKYKQFLKFDTLATSAWVFFNVGIGFLLAQYLELSMSNIVHSLKIIGIIVLGLFLFQLLSRVIYFRFLKKKKEIICE